MSWPQIVQRVISFAKEVEAGLLVVDTLFDWAGLKGEEENDAGAALNAMRPLQAVAAESFGVLVGRHDRKSGGEIGDSGRGSSAFAGVADVLLVLRRANTEGHPTRRLLLGVGRFDDVPEHQILELRDGHYVSLGDALNLERQEAKKILRDILPGPEGTPLLEAELRERMGDDVSRSTLKRALDELMEARQVKREKGYGKNKQAYGYWLVDIEVSSYRKDPEQVHINSPQNHVSEEDVSSPHTPEQLNIDNELSSPPPITEQSISEKEDNEDDLPF